MKMLSMLLTIWGFSWQAAAQSTPTVGKHAGANLDATSMILSLLMVLALIVISALVLKRFQPQTKALKGMKIVTTMHIGPKERLVVVQVQEEQLLLGVTANQINLIKTLDQPFETPLPANVSTTLLTLLKGEQNKQNKQKGE